jgi:hypothetical protein
VICQQDGTWWLASSDHFCHLDRGVRNRSLGCKPPPWAGFCGSAGPRPLWVAGGFEASSFARNKAMIIGQTENLPSRVRSVKLRK